MAVRSRRPCARGRRGNTLIEFGLVCVFLIPLLVGTIALGLNLTRSVQATQVARDAGHMYARFVDFSLPANKRLIVRLAEGLGMTEDAGNGVVYLSKVTRVTDADCDAAGLDGSACVNRGQYVILQRQTIGNIALKPSAIGAPDSSGMDESGNVLDYLRDTSARAENFTEIIMLAHGEFAFISEAWFRGIAMKVPGAPLMDSVYARSVF